MSHNFKNLPETIREDFPNLEKLKGSIVILTSDDRIFIKARGIKPRQVVKILCLLISKIL